VLIEVDLLDMLQDAVDEVSAEDQEIGKGSARRLGGPPAGRTTFTSAEPMVQSASTRTK
jgi:hypothetical protein